MLIRLEDDGSAIAIGQASHAWVSGQLARAWGNERFGAVEPWEEVCLGAEQHDIGWAMWDTRPSLNPDTGLPYTFLELRDRAEARALVGRRDPHVRPEPLRRAARVDARHGAL